MSTQSGQVESVVVFVAKIVKFAATVAAICLASAVAGTQAPTAMMALSRYFSVGERLQLAYLAERKDESVCLAVQWECNEDDLEHQIWATL